MSLFQQLNNNEQTNMMDGEKKLNGLHQIINLSIKSQLPYNFALILHLMYGSEYKYSKSDVWYYFENHIWRKSSDPIFLKNIISTEFYQIYIERLSNNNKDLENNSITDEEKENIKVENIEITNIITLLESESFREKIIHECKELFNDIEFLNKIDGNQFLIGFNNGVYDLMSGKFRNGTPYDYITLSTNINKIDFSTEDPQWNELNNFICTIFPNEEKRNYFMTYLSTCLQGLNFEQKFVIWVGDGANGKSRLEELFTSSFGDYVIKFPITLLTCKRSASNQCTPELVKARGKRFGYFTELSDNETINVGLIKEFTGGDKIYARGLNQDPIEFNPQFKLSLICNDVPKLSKNDEGLWRRLEIVPFTSKFTQNPNPENPNEFLIDQMLSEKMKSWKELFMAYLIDVYYRRYHKSNGKTRDAAKEVKEYTEEMKLKINI